MLRAALPCALAAAAAADSITLQPCLAGFAAGSWQKLGGGLIGQVGTSRCITAAATGPLGTAPCDPSNAAQQFNFNADGTVAAAGFPGNCWNVWGGATGANTPIELYACGSLLAANDVFAYLPTSQQIFANESELCLATAPPPPGLCASDADCNLNGQCNNGTCTCYTPWAGLSCGVLDLQPVPTGAEGYGMSPNLTSWGGNVVFYEGEYHLFVAEMVNNCSLQHWGSNSQVTHAVSSTPLGPYTYRDTALSVWSHNPQVVMFANATGATNFVLFHIGNANGGSPANCTTAAGAAVGDDASTSPSTAHAVAVARRRSRHQALRAGAAGSVLHFATSPNGPWTPVNPQPPSCNNPAPMRHANGTWFLLCDSTTLYSAPDFTGPWTFVTGVQQGAVSGTYEDAFLYMDTRGNWHVIYHVYNATTPCGECSGALVSGHSFSVDGLKWRGSTDSPFGNVVQRTDGSNFTVATRERPKLLFNAAGEPTHLVNGVCGGTATCPPTPGVNCKYNYWDFTLVQPLAV